MKQLAMTVFGAIVLGTAQASETPQAPEANQGALADASHGLPGQDAIRAAMRPPALEQAIRTALSETAEAAEAADGPQATSASTFKGDGLRAFERGFKEAKVPYCLHGDGLKRQPTFFLTGYVALPFIFVARARSKCLF